VKVRTSSLLTLISARLLDETKYSYVKRTLGSCGFSSEGGIVVSGAVAKTVFWNSARAHSTAQIAVYWRSSSRDSTRTATVSPISGKRGKWCLSVSKSVACLGLIALLECDPSYLAARADVRVWRLEPRLTFYHGNGPANIAGLLVRVSRLPRWVGNRVSFWTE
jgi:hypothetical protein